MDQVLQSSCFTELSIRLQQACFPVPMSPAEEGEVFVQLDEYSADMRSTQIMAVTSPVPNLARYQTYILNFDGSMYNEICEFTSPVRRRTL